mmetsp:Transcript_42124/g.63611  ORF Transcript_42124/g.63611 Transcript_42124/m.63611 type:complete len:244 (-) Transcript_42124:392-1123(-)
MVEGREWPAKNLGRIDENKKDTEDSEVWVYCDEDSYVEEGAEEGEIEVNYNAASSLSRIIVLSRGCHDDRSVSSMSTRLAVTNQNNRSNLKVQSVVLVQDEKPCESIAEETQRRRPRSMTIDRRRKQYKGEQRERMQGDDRFVPGRRGRSSGKIVLTKSKSHSRSPSKRSRNPRTSAIESRESSGNGRSTRMKPKSQPRTKKKEQIYEPGTLMRPRSVEKVAGIKPKRKVMGIGKRNPTRTVE